jgi:O-methyltransferase
VRALKSIVHRSLNALGYRIESIPAPEHQPVYDTDGLRVFYKQVPFLKDERFMSAYRHGIATAGDRYGKQLEISWRVAVTCWAARHGSKLPGSFVECGVNTGINSLAICEYLDLNALDKSFYLFDTFCGIPPEQMSDAERPNRINYAAMYPDCYDEIRRTFAPFPRAILVRGKVPDTLASVAIDSVSYLHIDMNIAYPERKAIEHFWPKLSTGALVVLDDYAWRGYEEQMQSMDEFARSVGVQILTLPTGQGLIVKS